jgi:hypothetical protein
MNTPEERNAGIARESARKHGEIIANAWMADHKDDFEPSQKNGEILGEWLTQNSRVLSYENLELAFQAKKAAGVNFMPPTGPRVDWAKRHVKDFDGSPESWAKIDFYLKRLGLSDDQHNLEQAFSAIRSANPKAFTTPKTAAVVDERESLPPTPPGCPVINTLTDLRKLDRKEQMAAQTGPHREAFLARCAEIIRRSGAQRPQSFHGL